MCKQAHSVHIFANSHDMLLLKFDLLNSLTGTLWAWHAAWDTVLQDAMYMYLQVYCCAVCICYGINSGANQRHATATVRCICALGETTKTMYLKCTDIAISSPQQVGIHTGFHHFMKLSQIFNKNIFY